MATSRDAASARTPLLSCEATKLAPACVREKISAWARTEPAESERLTALVLTSASVARTVLIEVCAAAVIFDIAKKHKFGRHFVDDDSRREKGGLVKETVVVDAVKERSTVAVAGMRRCIKRGRRRRLRQQHWCTRGGGVGGDLGKAVREASDGARENGLGIIGWMDGDDGVGGDCGGPSGARSCRSGDGSGGVDGVRWISGGGEGDGGEGGGGVGGGDDDRGGRSQGSRRRYRKMQEPTVQLPWHVDEPEIATAVECIIADGIERRSSVTESNRCRGRPRRQWSADMMAMQPMSARSSP